jgi:hypothetical protein
MELSGRIFTFIILYRIVCMLLVQTSYHPDEYYQYSEPSFQKVFDQGLQ